MNHTYDAVEPAVDSRFLAAAILLSINLRLVALLTVRWLAPPDQAPSIQARFRT